jgi:signal transduction histidine kinase
MPRRFFWGMAAFATLTIVFAVGGATLLFWLLAGALGLAAGANAGILTGAAILLVLILVGLGGLAARGARRALGPVAELVEAAERVESGDYGGRVVERGPRPVRGLARAFNAMSARLAADEEQRRRLLADVSHELRTPLAVIRGGLEGIVDGVYPPDEAHLGPLLEETKVMARLVEDLRTLSLSEAGSLKLHREPTDLAALLRDTASGFRGRAEAQGIALEVHASDDLPVLEVDPTRVREVVGNLVANALRYTPHGGRVEVAATRDEETVSISVRDTGQGIAPEALGRIFERFYRSADSPGSGLGLPIARNLVIAHGGRIEASSEPGRGTEIRFTLPDLSAG